MDIGKIPYDLQNTIALLGRAGTPILNSNKPSYADSNTNVWYKRGFWAWGGILVQWAYGKAPATQSQITFLKSFNSVNDYAVVAGSNYDPGEAGSYARAAKQAADRVEVIVVYGKYNEIVSKEMSVIAVGLDPNFKGFSND